MELQLSRHERLRYWAGTPNQHRQTNRLHRRVRMGAAQREFSRSNGASGFWHPWLRKVRRLASWILQYRASQRGSHELYKGDEGLWWLGKTSATTPTDGGIFGSSFG